MQSALPRIHRPSPGWTLAITLALSALLHVVLLLSGGFSWIHGFPQPATMVAMQIKLVSAPTSPAPVLSEPDSAPAPITPVLTGSRRNAPHAVIAGVHARAATAEAPSAPEPQARAAPSLSLQNLLAQAGDYATQQNETHSATSNGRLVYGASARGLLWSQYFDDWVRRMERAGAVNFPQNIRSLGLSGGPTLSVVINADGSLASLRIVRSSGNPVLDQATNDFVRSMAPFAPFPPPLAQQGSSVEFQRKWTFSTNNDASVP